MPLKNFTMDIELDGKQLKNKIIKPSGLFSDLPEMRLIIEEDVFDHLLKRAREEDIVVFPFKATAKGLAIETEAKIQLLGLDLDDDAYFVVFSLL